MIGYFPVIDDLSGIHRYSANIRETSGCRCSHKLWQHSRHIFCQIPAVRSGIRDQFFLVKGLCVVQRLLCRVAKYPVCFSLKTGQIIKCRRSFTFLCLRNFCDSGSTFFPAGFSKAIRRLAIFHALAGHGKAIEVKLYLIESFRLECRNHGFPLNGHGKGRGHNPPGIQRCSIQAL